MTEFGPDDLRRLARLVEESGLSELRYEEGDLRVTLRTAAATALQPAPTVPLDAADDSLFEEAFEPLTAAPSSPVVLALSPTAMPIEAPMMGVFYRASSPAAPPLVEVGDIVETGQPVGIIEAMKVFSEVLAEATGRVTAIPAANGDLVQPGDVLLVLEAVLS